MNEHAAASAFRQFYLGGKSLPIALGNHAQITSISSDRGAAKSVRRRIVLQMTLSSGQTFRIDLQPRNDTLGCLARTTALNVSYRDDEIASTRRCASLTKIMAHYLRQVEARRGAPPMDTVFPKEHRRIELDPERRGQRLELIIFPTDACNLRCRYCIVPFGNAVLSSERIARLFAICQAESLASLGVTFLGGEPLLGWDCIEDVTHRTKALWIEPQMGIVTNGTLLTAHRARYMADHDFIVTVSIDGIEDVHAAERVAKGSDNLNVARQLFRRSMAGLGRMIGTGAKVKANMVVTPGQVEHLTDSARFLLGTGVDMLTVSPAVGVAWGPQKMATLRHQLEGYAELMDHWLQQRPAADRCRIRSILQWEIRRAWYFMGRCVFNPDTRRIVLGPDGRMFSDLYNHDTEALLQIGHLDNIERISDLKNSDLTVPRAMYQRRAWSEAVMDDVMTLSTHLLEVLLEMDRRCFTDEPGARDLVGRLPQHAHDTVL